MQTRRVFSKHAAKRMAQRALSAWQVEYAILHGRRYHCAGTLHCFLGKRDIPENDRKNDKFARLEGTTVLLDPHNVDVIITVYRNRSALKEIRRKAKYNIKADRVLNLPLAG